MGERQAFRQHWLVALVLPGAPWLVLLAATVAAVLHLAGRRGSTLLFIPAAMAACRCLWLCLQWLAYTATVDDEANELVIQHGVIHKHGARVPLSRATGISYERPWWATLLRLDVATIRVQVFGDSCDLPYMDRYSELWQALQGTAQTGVVWVRRTQVQ